MYEEIKEKFKELEKELSSPELSSNLARMKEVSQKHSELKEVIAMIYDLEKIDKEIKENEELIKSGGELAGMAEEELPLLVDKKNKLELDIKNELKPKSPLDKKNVIMEIRGGTGGDESALFAADLFRMYSRFAERMGWKIEVIESSQNGIGGFKEIIFAVKGKNVYENLKYEAGTHRVQRVPETEKQGRVHTSAATVAVLPEAEEVDLEIKPNEIRIDTFCASGPGGQCVNTTYSAIRIVHIPTGLTVSCQDQKSQHQNKEKAMQILRSRLLQKMEDDRHAIEAAARKEQVGSGDRSEKIRTYNFPQDRITDHRIKMSWHSISQMMDGDIGDMINSLKEGLN